MMKLTRLTKTKLPNGRKKVSGYATRIDMLGYTFGILAPNKKALLYFFAVQFPHITVNLKKVRRYAVASVDRRQP
jgi:hypothetical protein